MSRKKDPKPEPFCVDEDKFHLCVIDDRLDDDDDDFVPYADIRIDTIPARDGDPDYSERIDLLRQAAAWMVRAAEWLEKQRRVGPGGASREVSLPFNAATKAASPQRRIVMRSIFVAIALLAASPAYAQQGSTYVSAQAHAEHLAATGTLAHCSRRGSGYEGIGMSSTSPDAAMRNCCYWGKRRVREIGTAWSAVRRAWIAVVRYE